MAPKLRNYMVSKMPYGMFDACMYFTRMLNSSRNIFHPDVPQEELPAHVYLRSMHNILIKRSWLQLHPTLAITLCLPSTRARKTMDTMIRTHFSSMSILLLACFMQNWPDPYSELCQWLWSTLLRQELKEAWNTRNTLPVRKQKDKAGLSVHKQLA